MHSENFEFNLTDFPENKMFADLDENFKSFLFENALMNAERKIGKLAKRLNHSRGHLSEMKRGIRKKGKINYIRLDLLKKLVYIAKIDRNQTFDKIISLRYGRNSVDISNIFPLKYDRRIAALVGHVTGDGHLKDIVYNFEYRNKSKELINKVYSLIFDIFNIKCKIYSAKDGTFQVEVPSVVGYILHKAGAPIGNKIKRKFDVPRWIMHGNKPIVSSYLGALIDDEFCISKSKAIMLSLSKDIEIKDDLINFIESIRYLFLKLNMASTKKEGNNIFLRKDGIETVSVKLNVCGQKNFIEFIKKIPVTNKAKIKALNNLINSYVVEPYETYGYNKIKRIAMNKLKTRNYSTTQLTKETKMTRGCFLVHLTRMKKEGLIKEVSRGAYREILWSLNKNTRVK